MKSKKTQQFIFTGIIIFSCIVYSCDQQTKKPAARIPVIYSTDLYHPPQDPDDHYDLAILGCLEELEIKALIFDIATSFRDPDTYGKVALDQMAKITGQSPPPWKVGLRDLLRSPDDQAFDQSEEYQGGVELILSTLEQSKEQVVMFLVGSCRDFAVAFNRNPDLLRKKVKSVYVNAGNGPSGAQNEWNVMLDPNAYFCLMTSGLPIYWCPCITDFERLCTPEEVSAGKAFCTYFKVANQAELLASARPMVKNYIAYALSRSLEDPLEFLDREPQPLPERPRNMWCTGPFLHAAGREIHQTRDHQWITIPSEKMKEKDTDSRVVEIYRFEPICFKTVCKDVNGRQITEFYDADHTEPTSIKVFRYTNSQYNDIMPLVLKGLLETL